MFERFNSSPEKKLQRRERRFEKAVTQGVREASSILEDLAHIPSPVEAVEIPAPNEDIVAGRIEDFMGKVGVRSAETYMSREGAETEYDHELSILRTAAVNQPDPHAPNSYPEGLRLVFRHPGIASRGPDAPSLSGRPDLAA